MNDINIYIAEYRGFCAGVERAIDILEKALNKYGAPIYVKHEIVHNQYVIDRFTQAGVYFIENVSEVPENSILIFSAHGVSKEVVVNSQHTISIDATCPLVTKVHKQVQRAEQNNAQIIIIGHNNHPEIIGTVGQTSSKCHVVSSISDVDNLNLDESIPIYYSTQTTLSLDDTKDIIEALKQKYIGLEGPSSEDICYATQNRQNAVKKILPYIDMLFVIGSQNSSNSNRLKDIGKDANIYSALINGVSEISTHDTERIENFFLSQNNLNIGLTAGASAPENLIQEFVEFIDTRYNLKQIFNDSKLDEGMYFKSPQI